MNFAAAVLWRDTATSFAAADCCRCCPSTPLLLLLPSHSSILFLPRCSHFFCCVDCFLLIGLPFFFDATLPLLLLWLIAFAAVRPRRCFLLLPSYLSAISLLRCCQFSATADCWRCSQSVRLLSADSRWLVFFFAATLSLFLLLLTAVAAVSPQRCLLLLWNTTFFVVNRCNHQHKKISCRKFFWTKDYPYPLVNSLVTW